MLVLAILHDLIKLSTKLDNLIKIVEITVPVSLRKKHQLYIQTSSALYYFYEYHINISNYVGSGQIISAQPYNFRGFVEGIAFKSATGLLVYQFDTEDNPADLKIRVVYTV